MKNLETKRRISAEQLRKIKDKIGVCYKETLIQTDTYFSCYDGRLKLREETGKESYLIRYNRPDVAENKISSYHFYAVPDPTLFRQVFQELHEELVVKKTRELYIIENARIHLDTVDGLDGAFMEVEVVMGDDSAELGAQNLMEQIIELTDTQNTEILSVGYRELLIEKNRSNRTPEYYLKNPQLYWVLNRDVNDELKANSVVPCVFTELTSTGHKILQIDLSIKDDGHKYTMWRKFAGRAHGIRIDVLLFDSRGHLVDLAGRIIDPTSIGLSSVYINRRYLAPFE